MLNTASLSRMSQKTYHMRYEKMIFGRIRCSASCGGVQSSIHVLLTPTIFLHFGKQFKMSGGKYKIWEMEVLIITDKIPDMFSVSKQENMAAGGMYFSKMKTVDKNIFPVESKWLLQHQSFPIVPKYICSPLIPAAFHLKELRTLMMMIITLMIIILMIIILMI